MRAAARAASRAAVLAAMPLFSMTLAAPAQAQQYNNNAAYAPVIRGFDVEEVRRLRPGVELNFNLYGTPGGRATLSIAGANRNLNLTETEPGQYEGTYTMGERDRISGDSAVTANLRVGNQVTSGVLSESLLRDVGRHPRDSQGRERAADVPRIARFEVQGNEDLTPGNELVFSVYGTPGAKVDMTIAGTRGVFFLPEVNPGEYSGGYTIRRADRIAPNSAVTATMRVGGRVSTAVLGKPLRVATATPTPTPRVVRYCTNCATVDAVNVVEVNGDGNYLGTIGGGVVGAVLGSQVGKGNGRTAAQIAGALGGAYVGRNIERNARKTQHYEVVIRFANGGTQTVTYENDPGLRVGEKVRITDGVLSRDQ
ncbi:Outer membrane lipoprotein [Janthinobacterium sp. CG23_2]|nr:Outer membrane lipoprotein [Janthinobacterium sp. CG23_2]CUU28580.1 Outer membrane lipoprotein [Janthinobacterium sp. CG23_2]